MHNDFTYIELVKKINLRLGQVQDELFGVESGFLQYYYDINIPVFKLGERESIDFSDNLNEILEDDGIFST